MDVKKTIFAIIGSTRSNSSNLKLVKFLQDKTNETFAWEIFEGISSLPHFNPDLDTEDPPQQVAEFRQQIRKADAILICTPEYVFSLPGSLKNAIEWCVSTTIFSQKPCGLITASASGEKGHEELKLVMRTVEARFTEGTALLIPGASGKFSKDGDLTDEGTRKRLDEFIEALKVLLKI